MIRRAKPRESKIFSSVSLQGPTICCIKAEAERMKNTAADWKGLCLEMDLRTIASVSLRTTATISHQKNLPRYLVNRLPVYWATTAGTKKTAVGDPSGTGSSSSFDIGVSHLTR